MIPEWTETVADQLPTDAERVLGREGVKAAREALKGISDDRARPLPTEPSRRIQRHRTKGWRMPDGAIYVGRPTRWGNPFFHVEKFHGRERALVLYEDMVRGFWNPTHSNDLPRSPYPEHCEWLKRIGSGHPTDIARFELAGHDLVCWCDLDAPCHADILLKVANDISDEVPA